jgi:hypothetical protein
MLSDLRTGPLSETGITLGHHFEECSLFHKVSLGKLGVVFND